MKSITTVFIFFITTLSFQNVFGGSPYHNDPHPFRAYYYGYDLVNAGFGLGPEFTIAWTKMEKSKCTHGARISDRQFLLSPQLGAFKNESNTLSLFGSLELDYRVTFEGGFLFEVFGAGGYAQVLQAPETTRTPSDENSTNKSPTTENPEAKSGFMPQAGIGFGYDLQKINGHDLPLIFNLRGLATTVSDLDFNSVVPAIQAGLIYSF